MSCNITIRQKPGFEVSKFRVSRSKTKAKTKTKSTGRRGGREERRKFQVVQFRGWLGTFGKFRNTVSKGRCAELILVIRLLAMGLRASLPAADDGPYDVIVESPATGRMQRVQVRASASKDAWGYYCVSCVRSNFGRPRKRVRYTAREIELFAFYVIPEDVWYIVPVGAVAGVDMVRIRPQKATRRQRWEKYREAWELMA